MGDRFNDRCYPTVPKEARQCQCNQTACERLTWHSIKVCMGLRVLKVSKYSWPRLVATKLRSNDERMNIERIEPPTQFRGPPRSIRIKPPSPLRLCFVDLTNMDLSSKTSTDEEGAKPEIRDKEGRLVDDPTLVKAGLERGMSMIDYEITYLSSPRFVFHDSRGIEAGAESDCHEYIQKFIDDRAQQTRTRDQLHAIWFCMPMDTPRVPSDEFELAFLEKVNCNVPVIAVLTKFEALVDRVKGEYKGRQVAKNDILNYARENVFNPLKSVTHAPVAIVQTHHKGEGCELLTKKTFEAIKNETLAIIFAMAQQNSMKLACQLIFKQNSQSILSRLKM
ncbi:hypothetical protein BGY98DRAFT_1190297, partial [Russula aff. rugulosa BPL654]